MSEKENEKMLPPPIVVFGGEEVAFLPASKWRFAIRYFLEISVQFAENPESQFNIQIGNQKTCIKGDKAWIEFCYLALKMTRLPNYLAGKIGINVIESSPRAYLDAFKLFINSQDDAEDFGWIEIIFNNKILYIYKIYKNLLAECLGVYVTDRDKPLELP